jgi:hypothetical protein
MAMEEGVTTPFFITLAVGAAVGPGLVLAVRLKQNAVYVDEERWAKEKGVTGHLLAVGHTVKTESELHLVIDLERAISNDQQTLFNDAIAAISPRSSIEAKKKRVTIHSGPLPQNKLGVWCRDVIERFLPKLEDHGVRRAVMHAKSDGYVPPDPD